MTDQVSTDSQQTKPETQAATKPEQAPAQPTIPAGMKMVSESDWNAMSKSAQVGQRFGKLADKDPSELEKAFSTYSDLKGTGVDIDGLKKLLAREQQAQPQGRPNPEVDIEEQIRQSTSKQVAEYMHQQGMTQQQEYQANLVKSLLGDNKSEKARQMAEALVANELNKSAPLYPEGHPLRNKSFAPMSKSDFEAKVAKAVKETWSEFSGQPAEKKNGVDVPTPGGGERLENRPDPNKPMSKEQKRVQLLADARREFASLGTGQPMSSA